MDLFHHFYSLIYHIFSPSVPSGFPLNITAYTLSSTQIIVGWGEFPEIDHNGKITHYEILYNQTDTPSFNMTDSLIINSSLYSMVLDGLAEFVEYNITVSALTAIGRGPFNPNAATNMTDASSKPLFMNNNIIHIYICALCISFSNTVPVAAGPPPVPPTPSPNNTIPGPPEDAVFTVVLSWKPPPHPGGNLISYTINLVAVGESSTSSNTTQRQTRQADNFLDNCIVGGSNNTDRNFKVPSNTTSLTVDDACMFITAFTY